jgi:hypothetical protein
MIRWLSQRWVSSAIDRGKAPPRLWRWTFGRLAAHREFASELRQLDGQLKRQAASQRRAIAREHWPIGDYPARSTASRHATVDRQAGRFTGWNLGLPRPAWVAGLCAVLAAGVWIAWPTSPTQSPQQLREATTRSFAQLWNPLSEQAQATGQALRNQTTHVTGLPDRLPAIDRMVHDLGTTIESPIREEMRRFTRDMTRPWTYLAQQMPRPVLKYEQEATEG